MRVLFCTDTYLPQMNGVSVVTAVSVEGLDASRMDLRRRRAPLSGGTPRGRELRRFRPEKCTGSPVCRMPFYPEVRLARPRGADIGVLIDGFRPDLVHCETEFGIGRAGKAAAARRGIPVVSSYHTDFARYADAYGAGWLKRAVRRLHRADFTDRSRRVYTPSSVAREDLLRLGLRDVEVWGRGVDTEAFHPGRRVGGAARGAGDGEPLHLSLRGTSCVGEARRRGGRMPSGWRARWCPGA